jgi:hypothetical protein
MPRWFVHNAIPYLAAARKKGKEAIGKTDAPSIFFAKGVAVLLV